MINLLSDYSKLPDSLKFDPGDVIFHKKYGYRGVVVDFDITCQAPDAWYQSNQSQPDRNQPWYHILVDGNQQVTYSAQSNLSYDQLDKPVIHPMLNLFFSGHDAEKNKYLRNNIPWDPGNRPDVPPPTPPPDFTPPLP